MQVIRLEEILFLEPTQWKDNFNKKAQGPFLFCE